MLSELGEVRRGPPVGRHVAAVGLTVVVTLIFMWIAGNPDDVQPFYLGHEMLAATSLVLLCLILMLGPAGRFLPRLRPVVPWGRELGIAMFVTAGLHVAMLNDFDLYVTGFFGSRTPRGDFELGTGMWDAANWVGAVAFGYARVQVTISNDWSQRKLGRGWKFLQRQTYTLFVLAWLHAAAFVLIGAGHGAILDSWLFWGVTTAAVVLQFTGFVHTVRASRGPSPYRVPPKSAGPGVVSTAAARWIGVVALWAIVIGGSWLTTQFKSEEERQVDRLCERYEEVRGPPLAEISGELLELAPSGGLLREWLEACDEG
jgi:DMSO/TMAO reductase YedYZ heme-binding membrane subunit